MEERKVIYFMMDCFDTNTLPVLVKNFRAIQETFRNEGEKAAVAYYYKLAAINNEFDQVRMQTHPLALREVPPQLCYIVS